MLGKTSNKVYDPFLKAGLGYQNPERLKKAIAAQPKMYHGEMLCSTKLKIDSPDYEETLEDVEENRLKMRNKMVQLNYEKLNALYETFLPQKEPFVKQTYFSFPTTSNECVAISELRNRIDVTLLEDIQRRWMSDSQNSLREFYKTDKNELLKTKLEKSLSDSKDIQANLLKRMKILENDFKRSQAQSIDFELKLQYQKEKLACDVSWKSRFSTLNDQNVLLKTQVDVVQERENIKLEYQKRFNSIKAIRAQHQKEVDELIEHVNQNTYAYGDVRTLLCVTPLPKNIAVKATKVSNTKVNTDRSKPVNSHSTPKNEQSQKQSANVTTRGMYRITKTEKHTLVSKPHMNVSTSTGVESSNSVRRPKSKDTKSKNRVLKNTIVRSSSAHDKKMLSSVSIDSNKCETMNLIVCQSNTSVLNTKTVNAVNDGSNIVCVSCGKDLFMLSHEKCVAHYALSRDSRVKRVLFTTPVAAKSKNFGATSVVAKSRLSVAKTPTSTNKVIQLVLWIVDRGCSKHMTSNLLVLRNFVEKFMGTVHFENDHFAAITGYGDYVQGNLMIYHVYYVEGLGHNLFSVGQFCDGDLEVASRESNLYTISISELAASSLVFLMSKATSTR
ncbi:hypothetical protein Tco_1189676 [Tanacetum coccineum]